MKKISTQIICGLSGDFNHDGWRKLQPITHPTEPRHETKGEGVVDLVVGL